eukprot:1143014-Pelagomonas_calceolata.AAC.2
MSHRLKSYTYWKFTVSTQKSVVICFNSRTDNLPPIVYDDEVLPYSDTSRYLGMSENLSLMHAASWLA